MSRIGKLPISIPAGVTVTLKENVVNVKECGTYYSYGEKEIKNLNCDLKKGTTHFNKVIVEKYGFC
jgi:ribosomal protein L6P/L9E